MTQYTSERFPNDFLWGTATASYQIEGAAWEDGRGESIWDRFCRTPGKVYQGHTGDVACDHYHRYESDVQMMADLGIQTYRFSVAWPRIFPERGRFNQKGIDFYKRLVNALHRNGIRPAATIYHWDLPQYLQDAGGWVNRDTAKYFAEFADTLFRLIGDDIPSWITHNEPWCASFLSYGLGHHAPGHHDWREAVTASHHLLLSHGMAVEAYRASCKQDIGITLNLNYVDPASDSAADAEAVRQADGLQNRWFLDPVFKGVYPADMVAQFERHVGPLDFIEAEDLAVISRPIDFLGINYYTRAVVRGQQAEHGIVAQQVPGGGPETDMGWEVHPNSLYRLLKRIEADYTGGKLPLYITENGAAYPDVPVNGQVDDPDRVAYLRGHLDAAHRFIAEGGNLKGYYVWSLMDNFEWAFGYSKRFGIVYVDYETQQRIPKTSAKWYSKVIATNGAER
ncbi:MAG: beta-glucosidase [Alicyclobacillus sp.]|nr:beta-glucosidase [Alicyclobacillus sp.]